MQGRATILLTVLLAVAAWVSRDIVITPFLDRIQSRDVEIAGCILNEAGEETLPDTGGFALYPGTYREPERGTVDRNSSVYEELRAMGVSTLDIELMTRETRKTFDWRKVRAGQNYDVYASAGGILDSLILYTSAQDFVRVHRDHERFVATIEQVPYTMNYVVTHGNIQESIFASLAEQNAPTALATSLDEIFGWTIDFVSDLRRGDEFVLLYERREYATGFVAVGDVLAARVINAGKEYNAIRFTPNEGAAGYYNEDGKSLQKSLKRAPLKFAHISSNFQRRRFHPVQKVYKPHYGVDYAAPRGTPVHATGDGLVVAATYQGGNGNFVKIRHNRSVETYYLHLAGFAPGIRQGARVVGGQRIGFVGSTGLSTGPHLCYRMMKNGSWINPRAIDLPARDPVTRHDMPLFTASREAYMERLHQALLYGVSNTTAIVQAPTPKRPPLQASVF